MGGGVTGVTTGWRSCGGTRGGLGVGGAGTGGDRYEGSLKERSSGSSPVGGTRGEMSDGDAGWLNGGNGSVGPRVVCDETAGASKGGRRAFGPVAGGWRTATVNRPIAISTNTPQRAHLRRNVCVPPFSGTSTQRRTTQALLGHELKRQGAGRVILPRGEAEIRGDRQKER